MRLDKEQYQIVRKLSKKYDLSNEQILEIIKAPFRFMREKIEDIEIDENWTQKEFEENTYNFNIPSIGKLHASYGNLKRIKNVKKKRRSSKGSQEIQGRETDR